MNLVNELQISAEKDDVLTVLRKTKRLVSKLDRQDISRWLDSELDGYATGQEVPDYRVIGSTVAYNTNGLMPAGFGYMKRGIDDLPLFGAFETALRESISAILAMIDNLKSGRQRAVFLNIEGDTDRQIRSHLEIAPPFDKQLSFMMRLNTTQITVIPERIKDKVLDWACALEKAGVHGDGMSFQADEKRIAHSVTFNINNCTIDQLTNLGTNRKS